MGCLPQTKDPECYQPVNVTVISGFVVRDTIKEDTIPGPAIPADTYSVVYTP